MIPILYDKTGGNELGKLVDILSDNLEVSEERNGMFDFIFEYPNEYPLSDQLIEENIIKIKPNDDQTEQLFRIYSTKKFIEDTITVFARHISFDLANDHVESLNLPNASCEYALNTLFRNSHFSKDFRGYSDIVNAQNYAIDNVNVLNAIAGKEGSLIDTYGTGAEILRDNKNFHILNKRGHDNGVTIEYGKNLTGFELTVDLEGLETRCGGFARYKPEGSEEEVIVKSDWIDSPFIGNFSHPYIGVEGRRDYSDKFKDKTIPTKEVLNKLCEDEFKINKRDIPLNNYKIDFIPLSKCVGYDTVEDKISLCDTVTIIDPRFNINTKAKVIKYTYDPVKERYINMELGEPRTTLGDVVGGSGSKGEQGPPGPPGKDGSVEDFPDTLPVPPVLTASVKGFASIDLSWTFEDKIYYTYELYASKIEGFTPNTFDLIHEGQSSSFLFQAKPDETWYFRVCAKNTHGNRTGFSEQVAVTTLKADNFDEYFSNLAVGNLVTNMFSADYMQAGIIKGHWIDAKHLSVTDGNSKRTLDIDSFGNVNLDVHTLKIRSKEVSTKEDIKDAIASSTDNMLPNSNFLKFYGKVNGWVEWKKGESANIMPKNVIWENGEGIGLYNPIDYHTGQSVIEYHSTFMKVGGIRRIALSTLVYRETSVAVAKIIIRQLDDKFEHIGDLELGIPELHDGIVSRVFEITDDRVKWIRIVLHHGGTWQDTPKASALYFNRIMVAASDYPIPWRVSNLDQITNRYSKIESDISGINLEVGAKVNSTDIISAINLSPERIKIASNNIDISGATTIGDSASGRYISIENEDYSVHNGNIKCLHFGYMNWLGREGLPEFLMGANGMTYNSIPGNRAGNFFGMATFTREKNPNSWDLDFHRLYYKRAGLDREVKIDMAEDGRMVVNTEHSFSVFDKGYEYLKINHGNGGLLLDNGFTAGRYGTCTFLKDIVVEGGMCHNDLQQGVTIRKYWGNEYTFRPTSNFAIDLGMSGMSWRNLYYNGNLIYEGARSSNSTMLCRSLVDNSNMSQSVLTYEDYFNYIKDTPLIENETESGINIVADYNNTSDINVRDKYMYNENIIDQTALLGVYQVALKEACLKISELENLAKSLVERIEKLESGCVDAK